MSSLQNSCFVEGIPGLPLKRPKEPKLIIAIDIGSTNTAASVVFWRSGRWEFFVVRCWGGNQSADASRVPTVLLYDAEGKVLGCGAEALTSARRRKARASGCQYAREFKLQLHPENHLRSQSVVPKALPVGVGIQQIYRDFLRYILHHTQAQLREAFGFDPWKEMSGKAEIVMTTPNLWGLDQQTVLEDAAIAAGLISRERAAQALHFIEEGEASARFFFLRGHGNSPITQIKNGGRFLVCDAGGTTVDISCYEAGRPSSNRVVLKETGAPRCILTGGRRIDDALENYLRKIFSRGEGSQNKINEGIEATISNFESGPKRVFEDVVSECDIPVPFLEENDTNLGVSRGTLKIPSDKVAAFFKQPVNLILEAIQQELLAAPGIENIILTGGFGQSPYLRKAVTERFPSQNILCDMRYLSTATVPVGATALWFGNGELEVRRIPRSFSTWLSDFVRGVRVLFVPGSQK